MSLNKLMADTIHEIYRILTSRAESISSKTSLEGKYQSANFMVKQ